MAPKLIPKSARPEGRGRIPAAATPAAGLLRFSFKYAEFPQTGAKFSIAAREQAYFLKLLERLKALSCKTLTELYASHDKTLRFHSIDWNDSRVSEKGFHTLPAATRQEVEASACQFSISRAEHGRVHGFVVDEVFYVVWWDPEHLLYPEQG